MLVGGLRPFDHPVYLTVCLCVCVLVLSFLMNLILFFLIIPSENRLVDASMNLKIIVLFVHTFRLKRSIQLDQGSGIISDEWRFRHIEALFPLVHVSNMGFGDLSSDAGLAALNSFLLEHSYIVGFTPSKADEVVYKAVGKAPAAKYGNVARWYRHITSYVSEKFSFPGEAKDVAAYGPAGAASAAPAPAAAAAAAEDDDIDLFGDDDEVDEEAEKIKAQRLAEYAAKKAEQAAKGKIVIAKSNIILDVKPWDDETDLAAMEKAVRGIEAEGLVWAQQSKLVPVGYGIKKLQIGCVVEDDKVGTDFLEEEIMKFEDLVQSVDIVAFNKI